MRRVCAFLLSVALAATLCGCAEKDGADAKKNAAAANITVPAVTEASDFDKAVELYETGAYAQARELFRSVEASAEVEQYLRLCAWGMVRDYLEAEGPLEEQDDRYDVDANTKVESICTIDKQGKRVVVNIQSTEEISYPILSTKHTTVTNTTVSFDGKEMQPELETKADAVMKGPKGSSNYQNVGKCFWDMASYEADAAVEWEEYIHIDKDGEMHDDRNAPAFNERVSMQQTIIASCLERILEDLDAGVTMADLGFANYGQA